MISLVFEVMFSMLECSNGSRGKEIYIMDKATTKASTLQEAYKLMTGLSKNDLNMIYTLLKRLSGKKKRKRVMNSMYTKRNTA